MLVLYLMKRVYFDLTGSEPDTVSPTNTLNHFLWNRFRVPSHVCPDDCMNMFLSNRESVGVFLKKTSRGQQTVYRQSSVLYERCVMFKGQKKKSQFCVTEVEKIKEEEEEGWR